MSDPFSNADSPPEKPPHKERLSVGLLLLWTAVTAALLGFHRATSYPTNGELGIIPQLMAFVQTPLVAVGLTAWVLLLWRWFTDGPRFPSQPGHWLLLLLGFVGVASFALRALILISLTGLRGSGVYIGIHVLTEASSLVLYAVAIHTTQGRWRTLFCLGAANTALHLMMSLFSTLDFRVMQWAAVVRLLLAWAFGLSLFALAISDLRQGVRRDTLHWSAVIVVGGHLLYLTAVPFLIWLVR